jgi:hypothetical protein
MGKAAHVGVGRLLRVGGLQGRGCMNNALRIVMPQYEEDVLQRIADGETASEILDEKIPTVRRRFRKATQTLRKIMDEVREEFPDANYYTGGGDGLELLLGQSHSFGGKIQSELIAESGDSRLSVGGGDW